MWNSWRKFAALSPLYLRASASLPRVPVLLAEDGTAITPAVQYVAERITLLGLCGELSPFQQCADACEIPVGDGEEGYQNIIDAFSTKRIRSQARAMILNSKFLCWSSPRATASIQHLSDGSVIDYLAFMLTTLREPWVLLWATRQVGTRVVAASWSLMQRVLRELGISRYLVRMGSYSLQRKSWSMKIIMSWKISRTRTASTTIKNLSTTSTMHQESLRWARTLCMPNTFCCGTDLGMKTLDWVRWIWQGKTDKTGAPHRRYVSRKYYIVLRK